MNLDIINSIFEISGAIFLIPSILKAHREKVIRGISILTPIFFSSWGAFNVAFFYSGLEQWWSTTAAFVLFLFNMVWLYQVVIYSRKGDSK